RTADPRRASDPARWAAAQRKAGGAAGDCFAAFPLPPHLRDADRGELLTVWDPQHGGRAAAQLVRQLVLQLRAWQPEVVVADFAGAPPEALVVEALREALTRAADARAFPEQIAHFRLDPWQANKPSPAWA